MIQVHKNKPPEILLTRGLAARKALCRDFNRGKRRFEFDRDIYAHEEVKTALRAAQHDKCCFCEAKFAHIQYGDVEHFRPKAGYKQKAGHSLNQPGYYWLAYEWTNLFACCQLCNQRHKHYLFPLRNPTRRAKKHTHDVMKEKPLFIDPARDDPAQFIGFRKEVAYALKNNPRGRTTIEVLQLNRIELQKRRRTCLFLLSNLKRDRDLLARALAEGHIKVAGLRDEMANQLQEIDGLLSRHRQDDAEYAAMARALLQDK